MQAHLTVLHFDLGVAPLPLDKVSQSDSDSYESFYAARQIRSNAENVVGCSRSRYLQGSQGISVRPSLMHAALKTQLQSTLLPG